MVNLTKSEMKKCFIITPIGSETDKIRRHIDGIIDAAIKPALGPNYKITVAHKISITGSITKQIINEIYSSDLVIANLTNKNPNVMYELSFRHCLGKPVIMIAEKGTELPFDLISERTIFYENDAKGVLELRDELIKFERTIDSKQNTSPIHKLLDVIIKDENIIKITKQNDSNSNTDAFKYIIDRLDRIENSMSNISTDNKTTYITWNFNYIYSGNLSKQKTIDIRDKLFDELADIDCVLLYFNNDIAINTLRIEVNCPEDSYLSTVKNSIENILYDLDINIQGIEYY